MGLICLSAITGSPDGGCEQIKENMTLGTLPHRSILVNRWHWWFLANLIAHKCPLTRTIHVGFGHSFRKDVYCVMKLSIWAKTSDKLSTAKPVYEGGAKVASKESRMFFCYWRASFFAFWQRDSLKDVLTRWAENKKGANWKSGSVTGTQILVCAFGRKMTIAGKPPSGPQAIV